MKNIFKEKLFNHKQIIGTRINSSWPMIAEIVGASHYYDYIEFMGEYAPYDQYDLENLARACELHGISSIMKIDYANRDYVAQKAIASGIQGILFTDHTNAQEVEETIRMVRPATTAAGGRLGYVNRRFYKNEGFKGQLDYAEQITQNIVIGFMIEKREAVDNIEEICTVKGVDFIQFGPADFSMNSDRDKNDEKNKVFMKEAEEKVIKAALEENVSPRIEINDVSEADYYMKLGIKHFALGSELRIEKEYWNNQGKKLREKFNG